MLLTLDAIIIISHLQSTMWHVHDERHRAGVPRRDAVCLERDREVPCEVYLLHSGERVIRRTMDTVHAVPNPQLEERIVSICNMPDK